jgi:hypothetical protein
MTHSEAFMHLDRRAVLVSLAGAAMASPLVAQPASDPDAVYDVLLKRYVTPHTDGINRIDFERWKATAADRADLSRYVKEQGARQPSKMTKAEAFAYWVNLYNAIHMDVVLEHYPVRAFSEIPSRDGPWKDKRIKIEGRSLSLDEMKSDVLRPVLNDARVHYAVNCASFGCPRLMPRAWRAATLDADLEAAARAFINHPRGVTMLPSGDIQVSSIYIWYAADFGGDPAAVIAHIRRYADPSLAQHLTPTRKLVDGGYDWSLVTDTGPPKSGG